MPSTMSTPNPFSCWNFCSMFVIGTATIITLGLSMLSFLVGAEHWNTTCDNGSFMTLPVWAVAVGIVFLVVCLVAIIIAIIIACIKEIVDSMIFMIAVAIISTIIILPFNIMGSIILFNYAADCYTEAYYLWSVSLAQLIFQWFIMGSVIIFLITTFIVFCRSWRRRF